GQDPAEELPLPRSLAPRPLQHESERAELAVLSQRMRSPDPAILPQSCQEVAFSLQAIKQRLMLHESTRIWRPPTPQPLPLHHVSLASQQQIQQFAPPSHSPLPRTTSHISRRTLLISLAALTAVTAVGIGWHNENTAPKVVDIGSPDEKPELALQL